MASIRTLLDFVKFEHTLFSLPLLLAGAFLGAGGVPDWRPLFWIVVAGTGARTVAMALNRLIDRKIDARNPRTADRELPAGKMSAKQAWLVVVVGLALFYGAIAMLPPLCLVLSPIPLAIFVVYPLLKRFTALAHLGVGAALAFGPIGAYVAVTGEISPLGAVHWLALFTWLWVAGFDVIYATLDEEFDRREGLHSVPSALGKAAALRVAAAMHLVAFAILFAVTAHESSTPAAWGILAVIGVLLAIEHWQVHRVDLAFFKINALLGFVVFAWVWAGLPPG